MIDLAIDTVDYVIDSVIVSSGLESENTALIRDDIKFRFGVYDHKVKIALDGKWAAVYM